MLAIEGRDAIAPHNNPRCAEDAVSWEIKRPLLSGTRLVSLSLLGRERLAKW